MSGARHVIAVDPVEWKREQATTVFGATHAASSMEEATALVAELTWGANADKAILTTGVATGDLIAPMMALVAKGGRAVVTAVYGAVTILGLEALLQRGDIDATALTAATFPLFWSGVAREAAT